MPAIPSAAARCSSARWRSTPPRSSASPSSRARAIIAIGLPEWVFPGALVVMALGFPVILFTGYTQYVARRVAQATPTHHAARHAVARRARTGTMAQLAVKASPHVSWERTTRGGIAALSAFALLVAGYIVLRVLGIGPSGSLLAAGKLTAQDKVLVAAFDAAAADSALGDVVAVAVRTNLAQTRAVQLVPTSGIVAALERMQKPATSRVDLALAREIAQREGIKAVVAGNVGAGGQRIHRHGAARERREWRRARVVSESARMRATSSPSPRNPTNSPSSI